MKLIWNWLSGKTYTETESSMVDEHGNVFMKTPNGFVSQDGTFINQVNNQLLNTSTGEWSAFSDVFNSNGHRTF